MTSKLYCRSLICSHMETITLEKQ
uniref:Uncharacterized protein n=1 Tax=Anguilla anguilla TaxID=7936 RepID=A0A0E9Q4B0_ANGAN